MKFKYFINNYYYLLICFFTAVLTMAYSSHLYAQNKVKIVRQDNKYKIIINNKETFIKGIGCGIAFGKNNENYLKLAKELNANTVRTWGLDQGTKDYLDEAHKQGLFVNAGLWLNYVDQEGNCSYLTDTKYQTSVRKEILDYIKTYKDHPAVIFWNVGNETFFFTRNEEERIAFARFLNQLIKDIKKIDNDHPVIYTSAADTALDYIIKYVPELDIFGINIYGGLSQTVYQCKKKKLDKPIIITEFGPLLEMSCSKDINQRAVEPNDQAKAIQYKNLYREISRYNDIIPGVFVFHLGETTQNSLSWWNINFHLLKRPAFFTIAEIFGDLKDIPKYPKIDNLIISKVHNIKTNEWLDIRVEGSFRNQPDLEFEYFCSTALEGVLHYYANKEIKINVLGKGPEVKIQAPAEPGIYRLYALVKDSRNHAYMHNSSIEVVH